MRDYVFFSLIAQKIYNVFMAFQRRRAIAFGINDMNANFFCVQS